MTMLHVVQPADYGCPPWCEVRDDHLDNDGQPPWWHHADRCVPYASADKFIVGGKIGQNPLGLHLERDGDDGPLRVVLYNEDEQIPVPEVKLTVAEAANLSATLAELVALARGARR